MFHKRKHSVNINNVDINKQNRESYGKKSYELIKN